MIPLILLIVIFVVQAVHSTFETIPEGGTPFIIDSKVHCKLDRHNITLEKISNCCEIELRCLEYDKDGELLLDEPDNKITFSKKRCL